MKLYGYFRSSAAYRVRIALNLKDLAPEQSSIHLTKDGGQQHEPEFRAINPQKRVPALALDTGDVLIQSLAIIEYLDEVHPEAAAAAGRPGRRAQVRALAADHRLRYPSAQQSRAAELPQGPLKHDQAAVDAWYRHWVIAGLRRARSAAPARPLLRSARNVTLADICLVPQVVQRAAAQGALRQVSEDRRGRCGLPEASRLRQGAAGKPARRRITAARRPVQAHPSLAAAAATVATPQLGRGRPAG